MSLTPGQTINDRYRVVRPLNEGGFGKVYLVHDLHQGSRPVALKVLRADLFDARAAESFKDEFRSMTRLRHPNLAEVHDFGTLAGDGRHFLTMELIEGRDLTAFRRGGSPSLDFESLAVQGLRALDYVHARGLLHNDIKPQNIMVRPPFQVKVLDFGLANHQAEAALPGLSGTVHYMPPERLRSLPPDPRSDLYSFGVVLYEMLTGRLPYQGEDHGKVITAILQGRFPAPRSIDPSIPERWETFVMALLAHEPEARPASAAAALELLAQGAGGPLDLDTTETRASFVTSGRFVGRDPDLAALVDLAAAHVAGGGGAGAPRLVLVSGASGIGKSRLLLELRHRLQLSGIRNVTGRFHEDGGEPFQAFVEILRQLPGAAAAPGFAARTQREEAAGAQSDGGSDEERNSRPDQGQDDRRDKGEVVAALAAALDAGADGRPGVLFVEDLHWSDAPGADLLEALVFRPARSPWLIVGTLRDAEARTSPVGPLLDRIAGIPDVRRMPLPPLAEPQVAELLASMVPFAAPPDRLARLLAERTEGNPLYVEELMRSLADEGTLRRGQGGAWIAESRTLDTIQLPPSLASAIVRRLEALGPAERAVLDMLAVWNRPTNATLLAAALGRDEADVAEMIGALDRLRLVTVERLRGGPPLVDVVHSRVRQTAYTSLDDARRAALHLAAGSAIEAAHAGALDGVVEELAHHFAAAGDRARGAAYCLQAAAKARLLAYPQTECRHLERALTLLPAGDPRRLDALTRIAADTAVDLGDYEAGLRASTTLLEEARRAGSVLHQARALRYQGWSQGFRGEAAAAVEATTRSLALARTLGNPEEIAWALVYLGVVRGRHDDKHQALEHFREAVAIQQAHGLAREQILTLGNTALVLLGVGEAAKARETLESALELIRQRRLPTLHYHYVSNLGATMQECGDLDRGIALLEEGSAWMRDHVYLDPWAATLNTLGRYYTLHGAHDRAAAALEEERRHHQRAGNKASLAVTLDYLGILDRELGRQARAEEHHREGLAIARGLSVRLQEGYLTASLATDRLESGDPAAAADLARQALEIGRALTHPRIQCYALSVLATCAARAGDRKALARATRDLTRVDRRGLRYHDRLLVNLTLGRCALLAGRPADAEREARTGLAASKGGFREFEWRFDALMADALAAKKLDDEASHFYNAALAVIRLVASTIEDPVMKKDYEAEQARRAVLERAGDAMVPVTVVRESTPPAYAAAAAKGDALKMLTTIYQIGQIINSILDLKELLNKVMDLAIDSVNAERGLIFLYRSETDEMDMVVARNMEHETIQDASEYSRGIVREAGQGRSILSHDAVADDRFKEFRSVTMFHIRSLLCVPLKAKTRLLGTVYVDTRQAGTVFSDDDLKFLEAFANQAAIAIENARLYEQVRQENRYLKAAVDERYGYENIIGNSAKMRDLFTILPRISASPLPVMIRGESGTGKELVARAIHHNSPRRDQKFFTENCAALPENLLESELFGHAKGAFTGADSARKGLFELADGGTLFLDEVGDMSLAMQSKLLRVLQYGEFRPVGSEVTRHVDVRVISATNRDLETMIKQKTFRQDLYYRVNVVTVHLPPLRDRRDDIPLLIDHFLGRLAEANKKPKLRVDKELMSLLCQYDWPGNVRQLENRLQRLALFASSDNLTLEDAGHDPEFAAEIGTRPGRPGELRLTAEDFHRALQQAKGNREEAARILKISRATFFRKQKELGIGQKGPRPVRRPSPA